MIVKYEADRLRKYTCNQSTSQIFLMGFYNYSDQREKNSSFYQPAPDDHIPIAVYITRCWPQSQFIKKVDFEKIVQQGNCAFAIYNLTTNDNKHLRNTEYYTFSNDGRIKSIECFFGGSGAGYPTNAK